MDLLSIKESLTKFNEDYLVNKKIKFEFVACLVVHMILWILQIKGSVEAKAYIGQLQGFISVYMAFRFGVVGTGLAVIINVKDIVFIIIGYLQSFHYGYLVGLIYTMVTIMWVIVMGILSVKQEKNRRQMCRLAITDDLTDLYNQRHFHSSLEAEVKNASKTNSSIGLVLIDIDNFRMYNDLYGHDYGDDILKNTAKLLKNVVNKRDMVFRFGSDEFAVLVKSKDLRHLEQEAKRIYDSFFSVKADYYSKNVADKITFSMGLSEFPSISSSKEELISHADMALYQAKNMGEDKINFYQDIMLKIHKDMKSDEQMIGVFKGLLSTITAKDKYTVGHCERVANYATMIGEAMGLGLKEIQTLLHAGLLHDIGKIELPKSVLNKVSRLTDEEFGLIKQHPINSAKILEPLSGMSNLIEYARHHHERFDGRGYPDGLSGREISLGARILCVADSFDAMVSDRPYRKSMSVEEAFLEIERCSGTQFDPEIANIFINIMKNKMSIKYNYKIQLDDSFLKTNAMQNT